MPQRRVTTPDAATTAKICGDRKMLCFRTALQPNVVYFVDLTYLNS